MTTGTHMEMRMAAATTGPKIMITRAHLVALLAEFDALHCQAAAAPKRKTKKAAAPAVDALPSWMPLEAWEAFLAMRVKIKKPATDYAKKLLIKKLTDFIGAGMEPQAILEQSITSGWQDLYALKTANTFAGGQRRAAPAPETTAVRDERRSRWGIPTDEEVPAYFDEGVAHAQP